MRVWVIAVALLPLALAVSACRPSITPERVKQVKLCVTTQKEAQALFGRPTRVGRLGNRTTWRYNAPALDADNKPPRLLLLFSEDEARVTDLAYDPPGMVELRDRCDDRGKPR